MQSKSAGPSRAVSHSVAVSNSVKEEATVRPGDPAASSTSSALSRVKTFQQSTGGVRFARIPVRLASGTGSARSVSSGNSRVRSCDRMARAHELYRRRSSADEFPMAPRISQLLLAHGQDKFAMVLASHPPRLCLDGIRIRSCQDRQVNTAGAGLYLGIADRSISRVSFMRSSRRATPREETFAGDRPRES